MELVLSEIDKVIKDNSIDKFNECLKIIYSLSNRKDFINILLTKNIILPMFNLLKTGNLKYSLYILLSFINFTYYPEVRNYFYNIRIFPKIIMLNLRKSDFKLKKMLIILLNNFSINIQGQKQLLQRGNRFEGLHLKRLFLTFKQFSEKNTVKLSEIFCNVSQYKVGQEQFTRNLEIMINKLHWIRLSMNGRLLDAFKNVCLNGIIALKFKRTNLGLLFILISFIMPSLEKHHSEYQKEIIVPIIKNVKIYKICYGKGNVRMRILDLFKHIIKHRTERIYVRKFRVYYVLLNYYERELVRYIRKQEN